MIPLNANDDKKLLDWMWKKYFETKPRGQLWGEEHLPVSGPYATGAGARLEKQQADARYDWYRQNLSKDMREKMYNGLVLEPSDRDLRVEPDVSFIIFIKDFQRFKIKIEELSDSDLDVTVMEDDIEEADDADAGDDAGDDAEGEADNTDESEDDDEDE